MQSNIELEFHRKLQKAVDAYVRERKDELSSGGVKTMEDYKFLSGLIQGLTWAREAAIDIERAMLGKPERQ